MVTTSDKSPRRPAKKPGRKAKSNGSTKSKSNTKGKTKTPTIAVYAPTPTPSPQGAGAYVRFRDLHDTVDLQKAHLLDIYRFLFETRRLEEHLVALYRQNKVVGGVYRSLGQEATAVGCAYALKDGDFLQPLIRDLGAMLVHGAMPIAIFRQYMARGTGPTGGRDLNQHFSDPTVGILGPVSMLGAMIPTMCGVLIAARHRDEDKVGLNFIGDGGSSTGAFYEGVNFAAVQNLPLIIVIEANHYAYSTPTSGQVPDGDLVRRARGMGCMVLHVDGNDVVACYEATRDARQRGINGGGPTIIVADTYRRKGHAEHDNQKYVAAGEIDDWEKRNDPLHRYVEFLVSGGHATKAELQSIESAIERALDADREKAVGEDFPDPKTLMHGVFADGEHPWSPTETWFRGGPPLREKL